MHEHDEPQRPEEKDLGFMIKQVDIACERQMNRRLRASGLTRSQNFMLSSLAYRGGQASLKELEADANVAQSTAWGIVSRLAEKGMVELVADSRDGRMKVARLTRRGWDECEKGQKGAQALEAHLREVFSPAEWTRFSGYLDRMLKAVESWEGEDR